MSAVCPAYVYYSRYGTKKSRKSGFPGCARENNSLTGFDYLYVCRKRAMKFFNPVFSFGKKSRQPELQRVFSDVYGGACAQIAGSGGLQRRKCCKE